MAKIERNQRHHISFRAERARREVEAGLAALRASFAGGRDGHRAFDREVTLRYPAFEVSGENH